MREPAPRGAGPAENRLEEIAELPCVVAAEAALVKPACRLPARRGAKAAVGLLRTQPAQLVVPGALFRVLEDLVGLAELLEAVLGIALLADVGMVFPRQLAVTGLDLLLVGRVGHAEDPVVVLEVHCFL